MLTMSSREKSAWTMAANRSASSADAAAEAVTVSTENARSGVKFILTESRALGKEHDSELLTRYFALAKQNRANLKQVLSRIVPAAGDSVTCAQLQDLTTVIHALIGSHSQDNDILKEVTKTVRNLTSIHRSLVRRGGKVLRVKPPPVKRTVKRK